MLKIRTRLIPVMLAVAVAVTAMLSATPVAAEATISELSKPYTFGTKATGMMTMNMKDTIYSFTILTKTTVAVDVVAFPTDNDQTYAFTLHNSDAENLESDYSPYYTGRMREVVEGEKVNVLPGGNFFTATRNIATGKAELRATYTDLVPGTYYVFLRGFSANSRFGTNSIYDVPDIKYELTVTPEPFKAGSVAADVTAFYDTASSKIVVDWDEVRGARYAVYYTYFNNTTKAFGEWAIATSQSTSYTIPAVVKNAAYYVTILPFSDIPSRQYGGFSPYAVVST